MLSTARHGYAVNANFSMAFAPVDDRGVGLAFVIGPRLAMYLYRLPEQGHALDANDPILDAKVIELAFKVALSHFLPLIAPRRRNTLLIWLSHNFERHPLQRLSPFVP